MKPSNPFSTVTQKNHVLSFVCGGGESWLFGFIVVWGTGCFLWIWNLGGSVCEASWVPILGVLPRMWSGSNMSWWSAIYWLEQRKINTTNNSFAYCLSVCLSVCLSTLEIQMIYCYSVRREQALLEHCFPFNFLRRLPLLAEVGAVIC